MKELQKLFNPQNKETQAVKIADLHLSSGQIIACDALVYPKPKPFTKFVEKGSYPVFLHYLESDRSIPYAELRITDEIVNSWEMALKEGQNINTLEDGKIFGFPVDTGLACFLDAETLDVLNKHEKKLQADNDEYDNYYDDYLDDLLDGDHCINKPFPNIDNNVVIFQSGFGDGFYVTYIGLNQNNKPAKFVIKFFNPFED